ncbi:MAG: DUF4340 domain-containing protein [Chloroflexota bacterium]
MNPRVTVGLLVLLVVLAGYLYVGGPSPSEGPSTGPGVAVKPKPTGVALEILGFADTEVRRVTVTKGGQSGGVEREGDGPWLLSAGKQPADRVRVGGLISRLAALQGTRRITEPGPLRDFGLEPPSSAVTIQLAGGQVLELSLGEKAPAESGTYAMRLADRGIFVISTTIAQDLERLVTDPPREPPTPTPLPPVPAPADSAPAPTPTR